MKTAISLPDELFARAEKYAADRKISRSELYAKALYEFIKTHSDDQLVDRVNKACEGLDTSLPDSLQSAARRSLLKEPW